MLEGRIKKNYLMLIGGAEERTGEMLVLKTVVRKSRAKNIIIIPSASKYPRDVINTYYDAFQSLGVSKIEGFDIRYNDEADRSEYLEKIEDADLVFFSGGDQKRLVDIFHRTRLMNRIIEKFKQGTIHIAGTSAGAAAVSNPILYDGDYNGFRKDSINSSEGLNLLPEITVDTHFLNRERIPRLNQFLASGLSSKGIGICEDTMIVIDPMLRFTVYGNGMVTVMNSEKMTYSNYNSIDKDDIINTNNIRIGFLSRGAKFSIKRWSVLKPDDKKKDHEINHYFPEYNYN
jgi:cyanophycinase